MTRITRRAFVAAAAAIGATIAWAAERPGRSKQSWVERRDLFAEGVASGDPATDSVLLWTRYSKDPRPNPPPRRGGGQGGGVPLTVQVAEDREFQRVLATAQTRALADADHTCRVLVGGLRPGSTYWYRFIDEDGNGSRIGRTRTAAAPDDVRPVKFSFVSCQNICESAQNAYRRMIYEDERAKPEEQLAFVLHLGDFIYEVVDYPESRPDGRRYDRRLRDLIRFPDGEKISTFHVAASLADYRLLYRTYLQDPDLQDARARWPFVAMWDNHEFSWMGFQSQQYFQGQARPAPTKKVMANQAWFEYQPARVRKVGGPSLERFEAPLVKDAPVERYDENGLGQEPNNLTAINSLIAYRTLQWGKHLDLIITDQHSYNTQEPQTRKEADSLTSEDFPELFPQELLEALDAGRAYGGGKPPEKLAYGAVEVPNFRKSEAPKTILGAEQKKWFLERLRTSRATWKVWGNSSGTLDWRADPQNIPAGMGKPWPGSGYACFGGGGDYGTAYSERGEIYDAVRGSPMPGFVTVSGDRHSFWAGVVAKTLPPQKFEPVGAAFITGSVSAPGLVEAFEHRFPKDHPLRPLYVADIEGKPHPAVNLLMHHGVRSCLEYQRTGDAAAARRASNPELAPHLSFLDMGGHGYATLRVAGDAVECEFVCIPRPIERSATTDGGPLRYRVAHRVPLWRSGERPRLEQRVIEGDPGLSI
jgi:alkaline phosphatase D